MCGPHLVICPGSFLRHAVDSPSLFEYFDLYVARYDPIDVAFFSSPEIGDLVCRKRSLSSIPSVSNFLSAADVAAAADYDRSDPADQSSLKATDSIEGRVEPLPRRVDPSEPVQPVYDVPRQLSVTRDDGPVVVSPSAFLSLSLSHSKWRHLLLNARLRAILSS